MAKITYKPGRVELETPYVQMFVDDIRTIPYTSRNWVPERRVWIVWDPYVAMAVQFVNTYYPNAEVVGQPSESDYSRWKREHAEDQKKEQERQRKWDYDRRRGYEYGSGGYRSGNTSQTSSGGSDHQTLYLTPEAPEQVVKAAYKALAILLHPDRSSDPNATRQMQNVNAAYDRIKKAKGWK